MSPADFDVQMYIDRTLSHNALDSDTDSYRAILYWPMGPMRREELERSNKMLSWVLLQGSKRLVFLVSVDMTLA
jgi:hypothetical protein